MENTAYIIKPHGWLGKLYDAVSTYSKDPASEIEKIASLAYNRGDMDHKKNTVLRLRWPLPGNKRETLEEVGRRLGGISRTGVTSLEHIIYNRFVTYLPEEQRRSIEDAYVKKSNDKERIPQMLNVSQVSKLLGVHANTVRRLSDSGVLTAYRIGTIGVRKFKREEIENYLESVKGLNNTKHDPMQV